MRKVKHLQRFCCLLLLLPLCCLQAHAAHKIDGVIGRTEYNGNQKQLISARHESNNAVSFAFAYWDVSAEDYSVYVGVKYVCDDIRLLLEKLNAQDAEETTEPETDIAAAVELSVNGVICTTAYRDETFPGLDRNRYDAESCFSFVRTITEKPDTNNFVAEIRLGLKYWMPYDSTLGIRIYDCSGNPSNFYEIPINPLPTQITTTQPETTTARETSSTSTTTAPATSDTTVNTTAENKTDVSSTDRPEAVLLNKAPSTTRLTLGFSRAANTEPESETSVSKKTTKPVSGKTTVPETGKKIRTQTTVASTKYAAVSQTEPSATASKSERVCETWMSATAARKFLRLNTVRIIGIVIATVLITAAAFISINASIRSKTKKENDAQSSDAPETKPDDVELDDF